MAETSVKAGVAAQRLGMRAKRRFARGGDRTGAHGG
jgi:hypothetical protein